MRESREDILETIHRVQYQEYSLRSGYIDLMNPPVFPGRRSVQAGNLILSTQQPSFSFPPSSYLTFSSSYANMPREKDQYMPLPTSDPGSGFSSPSSSSFTMGSYPPHSPPGYPSDEEEFAEELEAMQHIGAQSAYGPSDRNFLMHLHLQRRMDPRFNPPVPTRKTRALLLLFFVFLCLLAYKMRVNWLLSSGL